MHKLISMQDAARLCSYEQGYLSLLARRGEMRAEKVGRNWFTTVEWLNDYIATKKPNEVITELPRRSGHRNTEARARNNQKIIWGFFIFFSIVLLVGAFIFRTMYKKVSDIENKTKNQFVPEMITKVPNDNGGYDVYGEGRMRLGTEDRGYNAD